MEHHNLDIHPIPKDSKPLFINEPWLIDSSLQWRQETGYDLAPLEDPKNIRIYVPLDLCKESILRRLSEVISRHGEASEKNEADYTYDVVMLISQIEIYDQMWFARHMPTEGKHSAETIELVKEFVQKLEEIEVYAIFILAYACRMMGLSLLFSREHLQPRQIRWSALTK